MSDIKNIKDLCTYLINDASTEEKEDIFFFNHYLKKKSQAGKASSFSLLPVLPHTKSYNIKVGVKVIMATILEECHISDNIVNTVLEYGQPTDDSYIFDSTLLDRIILNPHLSEHQINLILLNPFMVDKYRYRLVKHNKVSKQTLLKLLEQDYKDKALALSSSVIFEDEMVSLQQLREMVSSYEGNPRGQRSLLEALENNPVTPVRFMFEEGSKEYDFSNPEKYVANASHSLDARELFLDMLDIRFDFRNRLLYDQFYDFKNFLSDMYNIDLTEFDAPWIRRFVGWGLDYPD